MSLKKKIKIGFLWEINTAYVYSKDNKILTDIFNGQETENSYESNVQFFELLDNRELEYLESDEESFMRGIRNELKQWDKRLDMFRELLDEHGEIVLPELNVSDVQEKLLFGKDAHEVIGVLQNELKSYPDDYPDTCDLYNNIGTLNINESDDIEISIRIKKRSKKK